jgi:serine-type D-Ala-D-Ala carboxypeptidase (penicillin-binding protein 5/6)
MKLEIKRQRMKPIKKVTIFLSVLFFIIILMILNPFSTAASNNEPANIFSGSAVLIDGKTGTVLYEKNSNQLMYPASITKILTAIIAIEEGDLSDKVVVSQNARDIEGTRVYLEPGEKVTLKKLVQGLLINSGNDAGVAIAEHMAGNVASFSEKMNRFAKEEIGVKSSIFQNPHGLFDPNHQTTAYDMAMITKYAMKNKEFREIFKTKELRWIGEGWDTTLYNHQKMLWRYEGVTGGKNGYVDQSGITLVTTATRGETDLIAVTLKADSSEIAYSDTTKLLDYGFSHFQTQRFSVENLNSIQSAKGFILNKELFFTAEVNITTQTEVNSEGILTIKDNNDKVLLEHPLSKELKKVKNMDKSKGKGVSTFVFITYLSIILYTVILILLTFAIRKRVVKSKKRKFTSYRYY